MSGILQVFWDSRKCKQLRQNNSPIILSINTIITWNQRYWYWQPALARATEDSNKQTESDPAVKPFWNTRCTMPSAPDWQSGYCNSKGYWGGFSGKVEKVKTRSKRNTPFKNSIQRWNFWMKSHTAKSPGEPVMPYYQQKSIWTRLLPRLMLTILWIWRFSDACRISFQGMHTPAIWHGGFWIGQNTLRKRRRFPRRLFCKRRWFSDRRNRAHKNWTLPQRHSLQRCRRTTPPPGRKHAGFMNLWGLHHSLMIELENNFRNL